MDRATFPDDETSAAAQRSPPIARRRSALVRRSSIDPCVRLSRGADRRCSFSSVLVREHSVVLGDPATSCVTEGAPITLGWQYLDVRQHSLDDFEREREPVRRRRSELVMGAEERRKKLISGGNTLLEVMRAERLVALKHASINSLSIVANSIGSSVSSHLLSSKVGKGIERRSLASRAA